MLFHTLHRGEGQWRHSGFGSQETDACDQLTLGAVHRANEATCWLFAFSLNSGCTLDDDGVNINNNVILSASSRIPVSTGQTKGAY